MQQGGNPISIYCHGIYRNGNYGIVQLACRRRYQYAPASWVDRRRARPSEQGAGPYDPRVPGHGPAPSAATAWPRRALRHQPPPSPAAHRSPPTPWLLTRRHPRSPVSVARRSSTHRRTRPRARPTRACRRTRRPRHPRPAHRAAAGACARTLRPTDRHRGGRNCGPDRYCVPSPSLLQLTIDTLDAGIDPGTVLRLLDTFRAAADSVAESVLDTFARIPRGPTSPQSKRSSGAGAGCSPTASAASPSTASATLSASPTTTPLPRSPNGCAGADGPRAGKGDRPDRTGQPRAVRGKPAPIDGSGVDACEHDDGSAPMAPGLARVLRRRTTRTERADEVSEKNIRSCVAYSPTIACQP